MEPVRLETQEAVQLAHALVGRLAQDAGLRVLFIKGPTAVAVGARPDRPSSDADVLVDPAGFEALCAALESSGWQLRNPLAPPGEGSDLALEHSAHFLHTGWPCDIDLHYQFPGFLAAATDVFEALWERRVEVMVAGRLVTCPDVLGQALVVTLHALRDPRRPQSQEDLEHVTDLLAAPGQEAAVTALVDLAQRTGSVDTTRPFLQTVTQELPAVVQSRALADWEFRQRTSGVAGSLRLAQLRRASWGARVSLLRQAIVPSRELLLSSHLLESASRRDLLRLHAARWSRGVRGLPEAVRSRRLHRTG